MNDLAYKQVSSCLFRVISGIIRQTGFSRHIGLLNGKTGIAILLYHYARHQQDPQITDIADKLIDDVIVKINDSLALDSNDGLTGIAWGIQYLIRSGFVEADEHIFDEIDLALFRNTEKIFTINNFAISLYMLSRLETSSEHPFWKEMLAGYFRSIRQQFIQRYTKFAFPVYACRDLLPVLYACIKGQEKEWISENIDRIYHELPMIIEVAAIAETNFSDKFWLSRFLEKSPLMMSDTFNLELWESPTLMDINEFYMSRLLYGNTVPTPNIFDMAIPSLVNDTKRIDELLSLLNPNNIGLGNYITGLAWALLQWCMEYDK